MRIFLAGGAGVLARRVLPALLAAGHDATTVACAPVKAVPLLRTGAAPGLLLDARRAATARPRRVDPSPAHRYPPASEGRGRCAAARSSPAT